MPLPHINLQQMKIETKQESMKQINISSTQAEYIFNDVVSALLLSHKNIIWEPSQLKIIKYYMHSG